MAKVEIITRAFNRLEYTVLCVRDVARLSGMDDYKHIIINQNSTDGTGQWLNSLIKEGFYKIKVQNNSQNTGDAGGMQDGFKLISDDCEYVVQLDNDCRPITDNFLKELVKIMDENKKVGAIMLKREGVGRVIEPSNIRTISGHLCGDISFGTCGVIFRRKLLDDFNIWMSGEQIGWGKAVTSKIREVGFKVLKCLSIRIEHIDGSGGQYNKYKHYFLENKNNKTPSNYSKITYGDNK